jgi:hypothetical protein
MTTDKKTDARKLDYATLEVMRPRAIEATKAGTKATVRPGSRAAAVSGRSRSVPATASGGSPSLGGRPGIGLALSACLPPL